MSVARSIAPRAEVERQQRAEELDRVPYPILACRAAVLSRTEITSRMVRVRVGGPDLARMHTYQCDDHVAVVLPEPDGTFRAPVENDRLMLDWPKPLPPARKYTICRYDRETLELDLDFVRHSGGVAAAWAESVRPGEQLVLAGPPGVKTFPHGREHYVFAVDFTALPAAARWLEEAPAAARTDLVVVMEDPTDRDYPLALRGADTVRYVSDEAQLVSAVAAAAGAGTFVFVAGEAGMVRTVRVWCKQQEIEVLATGYWKRGVIAFHD